MSIGARVATSTGERAHCTLGRVMSVPAAASSGAGERQRRVNGTGTAIVAKFGKVRRSGKRAQAQQRLGHDAECVVGMPARLDEHGHRVNSCLMPRLA